MYVPETKYSNISNGCPITQEACKEQLNEASYHQNL
jgi:hypothetical protein